MHYLTTISSLCSGSEYGVGGNCYKTNIPTVSASSSELHTILQMFFGILAAIAVLFVVIGGFRYTISSGDPKSMQEAKDTILYAVIGLVVALFAESIVTLAISFIK